jgi:hypothetical protein
VVQFDCANTVPEQVLQNVMVAVDMAGAVSGAGFGRVGSGFDGDYVSNRLIVQGV